LRALRPGLTIPAILLLALLLPVDKRGPLGTTISARAFAAATAAPVLTPISIDYPEEGSIFPPGITPPTFLWRDAAGTSWSIDISFADNSAPIHATSKGERMQLGPIDPDCVADSNSPPALTPQQAATWTWKPDAATWAAIQTRSAHKPTTVTITGYRDGDVANSQSHVTFTTSIDEVGAPIFYRDVPLMPASGNGGAVAPLAQSNIHLIHWRIRDIRKPESHTVLKDMPTCANCHSFSADGKTLGLDVDGPQNDHGLYALIPVAKQTVIRTQDVIKWPTVRDPAIPRLRAAFMSQVSPDGRYVLSTIDDAEAAKRAGGRTLEDKYYVANFLDYRFLQVFYPTRGTLAWYDRKTNRLQRLPGADDPRYVQAGGVWSPDGKYVVFVRAEAKSPYAPGVPLAIYANDPKETQVRFDLYRIPFNEGKGGTAEPVRGASGNGMSNSFPKISPDGRWIVFVQARNGMVMRPDGKLYIVPAEGGVARLMECNTPLMNSWHTFSPNGRWMAFSSKSRSPYTQLYLTHLDAHGNSTPPILVDNTTAANRAVNLPEFANIPKGGLEKIDPAANEYYRMENSAIELMTNKQFASAISVWRNALERDPSDGRAHLNLAYSLGQTGQPREALAEFQKACDLSPDDPIAFAEFALALAQNSQPEAAIVNYEKSLALDDANAGVQADLGGLLVETGKAPQGFEHLEKAVALKPESAAVQSRFAVALLKAGKNDQAIAYWEKAVALSPDVKEFRYGLAAALAETGRASDAIAQLQKAIEKDGGRDWQSYDMLASVYIRAGRIDDAIQAGRHAIELALPLQDGELVRTLRAKLANYEQALRR
jgi:tetratricopeptide (TPR) repeat protein